MESFSDYSVWSFISILAVLLIAMLLANLIKKIHLKFFALAKKYKKDILKRIALAMR